MAEGTIQRFPWLKGTIGKHEVWTVNTVDQTRLSVAMLLSEIDRMRHFDHEVDTDNLSHCPQIRGNISGLEEGNNLKK